MTKRTNKAMKAARKRPPKASTTAVRTPRSRVAWIDPHDEPVPAAKPEECHNCGGEISEQNPKQLCERCEAELCGKCDLSSGCPVCGFGGTRGEE